MYGWVELAGYGCGGRQDRTLYILTGEVTIPLIAMVECHVLL